MSTAQQLRTTCRQEGAKSYTSRSNNEHTSNVNKGDSAKPRISPVHMNGIDAIKRDGTYHGHFRP